MKIVVDSNRIVAALIKDNTTRSILFNTSFNFIAPEFILQEINKYKTEFIRKAKLTSEEYGVILSLIFDKVKLIPKEEY